MTSDPTDKKQLELVAAIAWSFTFQARESGEAWERVKARAEEGGGYAGALVARCYEQALVTLGALARPPTNSSSCVCGIYPNGSCRCD